MMTSAQVVETSVTVTDNSPFQGFPHPDDHTTRSTVNPIRVNYVFNIFNMYYSIIQRDMDKQVDKYLML